MKNTYIECSCSSGEHVLRYIFDDTDGELYTEVVLGDTGFFRRVWKAVKYIFGYKSMYGHYDCTLISRNDYDKLIDVIQEAKDWKEKKHD